MGDDAHMGDTAVVDPATPEVSLDGVNPFTPAFQQCPHAYYAKMRDTTPVFHVPGTDLYMVTRHDLIVPIVRNTTVFSSRFGSAGEPPKGEVAARIREVLDKGWVQVPTMLTIDPPEHSRYRMTVASYFKPAKIAELRPAIEAITAALIDRWIAKGAIEVVQEFSVPLPVEVIAHVLNVPSDRMADFKRWSDDSVANIGTAITDDRRVEAYEGIVEFQHYFAAELERRRAEPMGDLLTDLVQARIPSDPHDIESEPRELNMSEMLSITQQLLVAGNETTTKAITEGIKLLALNPDRFAALQADPSTAAAVTEEVLRLATPTQGMFRLVTEDTEIEGVPIPKGSRLVLVYSAANRDPSVFDDPDGFDPTRNNLKEQLAFGKGIHFCLGAPLSRLEMTIVFEQLARRLATLRLADGTPLEYEPSFMLRGLQRLDIEFTEADA
jgi:cytochrome P450